MRNFSTWLLVAFMGLFWLLRLAMAVTNELGSNIMELTVQNQTLEVILLFVVLVCIVLIVKRNIVGALIYLLGYGIYFGTDIYQTISLILSSSETISYTAYLNTGVSMVGIILPVAILLDLLVDKNRKKNPVDKKTDWFYKNENFDRKLDERADKNNYRSM